MATYRILRIFDVAATQRAVMEFPDDAAALAYMAGVVEDERADKPSRCIDLEHAAIQVEDGAEQSRGRFWLDRVGDDGDALEDEVEYFDCLSDYERAAEAGTKLRDALRAILPYAESRAEDMQDDDREHSGNDEYESEETAKAVAAVDAAKALLASLDGDAPDAADASEGAGLLVIWELPYSPDVAKDALGHFTPAEAAALLGMDQSEIAAKLDAAGSFQTEAHHVERDE